MEIMPSDYQQIELSRYEKLFIRYAYASDKYGFFLVKANPAMMQKMYMHVLLINEGVVMFQFFDACDNVDNFEIMMKYYRDSMHAQMTEIIVGKIRGNKSLVGNDDKIKIPVNIVYVFPKLNSQEVLDSIKNSELKIFVEKHCIFMDKISKLRNDFDNIIVKDMLSETIAPVSKDRIIIQDNNINSILQRLTPEYTTIRVAEISDGVTTAGADDEMLVVTEDDKAVKAFRLDKNQINIVNKIRRGEQLILACAGSGKSVLLIAKCFKAAAMNPDKKFLITCYNDNLRSLYSWFIDRAGFRERNVECMTFHKLCRKLLERNGLHVPPLNSVGNKFAELERSTIYNLNSGKIQTKYYGIFIDEVQIFTQEWYKLCYNLLENKESDDHIFVICGDKTQKIVSDQKHGKAPWNAGEGYPNYRGGNKSIRIERNYRNCIEINEYINRYATKAKDYFYNIQHEYELDPDMFLRGKSESHGDGVKIRRLKHKTNKEEANEVLEAINEMHVSQNIPYDEIAVIMFNSHYNKKINGWFDSRYDIETHLCSLLDDHNIEYCKMYQSDDEWAKRFGDGDGVRLLKFGSVLGLDFRGAIICGLMPFGYYDDTKKPNLQSMSIDSEEYHEAVENIKKNISLLYVACTRAKDSLQIILPEDKNSSEYIRLLEESL